MGDKFTIFGKSHTVLGESSSDLILRCRGAVKIQWGNKFIDLIKDGKINVNFKFIYIVNTKNDIKNKDGLYITSDGSVYLKSEDILINLIGEIGNTYVSFMGEQQTTSDQKYTALKNIGFIYDNLDQINETSLQNGLIYVQSTKKLYIISNGQLQEFSGDIPNPLTQQFVIEKNDDSKGALVIKGKGINNSITFDSLYIYTDNESYINSGGALNILIGNNSIINIQENQTTFNNVVLANTIQSVGATTSSGFRLYTLNGQSTLEIDNVIERNKKNDIQSTIIPEYYSLRNNIINSYQKIEQAENEYIITLKYENKYIVGDQICMYGENMLEDSVISLIKIIGEITEIDQDIPNSIHVNIIPEYNTELQDLQEFPNLTGVTVFLIGSSTQIQQLRYTSNSINLLQNTSYEEDSVKLHVGDLTNLNLTVRDNQEDVSAQGDGLYSETVIFKQAQYESSYQLDNSDNSSKAASTEWVHHLLPKGSIIMFDKSFSVPDGWNICDGTNNTPDLQNQFITVGNFSIIYIIKIV